MDLSRWLLRSQVPHTWGLLGRSKNTLLIRTQVSQKNRPVQYGDQSLAPRAILSGLVPTVICYSSAGRSVLGKTVPEVLSTAQGPKNIIIKLTHNIFMHCIVDV